MPSKLAGILVGCHLHLASFPTVQSVWGLAGIFLNTFLVPSGLLDQCNGVVAMGSVPWPLYAQQGISMLLEDGCFEAGSKTRGETKKDFPSFLV